MQIIELTPVQAFRRKDNFTKLLCRLYDPSQGAIVWNGQDLRSLSLEDLRSAVVMQERSFSYVRENVAFG